MGRAVRTNAKTRRICGPSRTRLFPPTRGLFAYADVRGNLHQVRAGPRAPKSGNVASTGVQALEGKHWNASSALQSPLNLPSRLFADAEIPEYHFQNVLDINAAGEAAKGVGRGTQLLGKKIFLRRDFRLQGPPQGRLGVL